MRTRKKSGSYHLKRLYKITSAWMDETFYNRIFIVASTGQEAKKLAARAKKWNLKVAGIPYINLRCEWIRTEDDLDDFALGHILTDREEVNLKVLE